MQRQKRKGVVLKDEKDSVSKAVDAYYNGLSETQISNTGITKKNLVICSQNLQLQKNYIQI